MSSRYKFHENLYSDNHTLFKGFKNFSRYSLQFRRLSQNCERRLLFSSYLPLRMSEWNNSAPTEMMLMKFGTWGFLENLSRKFKFHLNLTRITATLREDVCTFITTSGWILLRMRNVSDRTYGESKNTHFMFSNFFFENRAVCEIMWKIMVGPDRLQIT